jgi:hypothetical protein
MDGNVFWQLIAAGHDAAASRLMSEAFGSRLTLATDDSQPPLIAQWEATRAGSHFTLSRTRAQFAGAHLACVLPIAAAYHAAGAPIEGTTDVSLEDHHLTLRGLSFCDFGEGFLIPDPAYIGTDGYAAIRAAIDAAWVPWERREKRAFWRGSTTGRPEAEGDWRTLPRLRLCGIAAERSDMIDAGITAAVQWDGMEVDPLIRRPVQAHLWQQWRYQIDIDGNSNAWAGMFHRMLSGSPVLKVASPMDFRQWYYHRMLPWVHYVPVRSDMSDLQERIEWLRGHDGAAREIGAAGRRLALSMTCEGEVRDSVPVVMAAIRAVG